MKSEDPFYVQSWPGSLFVFLDITLINLHFNAVMYVLSKKGIIIITSKINTVITDQEQKRSSGVKYWLCKP